MSDDKDLQRMYAALRRRDAAESTSPIAELEELQAFAERPPSDDAGLRRLDAILSDPRTREEYVFLRGLAREGRPAARRVLPWLAIAAAATLIVGAPLVMSRQGNDEPVMRGDSAAPSFITPAPGQTTVAAGMTLAWVGVPNAHYDASLLDQDAAVVWSVSTADTTARVPAELELRLGGAYTLQVTARQPDGTIRRSAPVSLTAAR